MEVRNAKISDVKFFYPTRHSDSRGFLSEIFRKDLLQASGIDFDVVQENYIRSSRPGTIRGLHFQIEPFAQAKLVRVVRGSIYDVALDVRRDSPTFGQHVGAVLDAREGHQIFIPEGFAHAFCALEPETEIAYKINNYRSVDHERGLLWNDPALGIAWPVTPDAAVISERDLQLPSLASLSPEIGLKSDCLSTCVV